jgi:uncharacterized sporulation protein YeaH/YhbH (DUF444 family)
MTVAALAQSLHTIKDDVLAADSKQDFSQMLRLLKDNNKGAIQEMVRQGKLIWLDYGQEVSLESIDVSAGAKEVRIKGTRTTTTWWIPSIYLD